MNIAGLLVMLSAAGAEPTPRLRLFRDRLLSGRSLVTRIDRPGLLVLADPRGGHLQAPGRPALIWGHLFDRASGVRVAANDADQVVGMRAADLLERFWGAYLAVRVGEAGAEILRDPSGGIPCYHCELDGCHILTTQPHLLFEHGLLRPEIDWTVVAQGLVYRDLRPAQTALRGITEVLPGAILHIRQGIAEASTGWSPWIFARPELQVRDPEIAVTMLREALLATLAAWSNCFDRILIEVSGGLDSAIVAAGLGRGSADLACVTFGPEEEDASELPWARAVAETLGLPLTELAPATRSVDVLHSDAARLPRPCAHAFSQAMDRPIQQIARDWAPDAFAGGGAGDSIFCFQHSALPVIDRFRDSGAVGLLRTAADMARVARTDIWTVLLGATRQALRRSTSRPRPRANPFIAAAIKDTLPWPAGNPWLEAPAEVLPGKKRHVWSILALHNHLEGYGREALAPHLAPLISQPILEACLRIPSWHWCLGGVNRAAARRAFHDLLPASVIQRTTKLSFNGVVRRVVENNREQLRELILDGELVRQGLVDRALVEDQFAGGLDRETAIPDLMALADIEAWIQAWRSPSSRT